MIIPHAFWQTFDYINLKERLKNYYYKKFLGPLRIVVGYGTYQTDTLLTK